MHHFSSLRRAALGAAIAGAAIVAVPAVAGASTCGYAGSSRTVTVVDSSGTLPLRISNDNGLVIVKDGPNGAPTFCGGSDNIANVGNTDQINVFGPVSSNVDGLVVDETGGLLGPGFTKESPLGSSEIEIKTFTDANRPPALTVIGRASVDTIRVAGSGVIDLGGDGDVDVSAAAGANFVTLNGGAGEDLLDGSGFFGLGSTTARLFLNGGPGADQLIGGLNQDDFNGGSENDVFHAINGSNDVIFGGPGVDTANADKIDRFTDVVEIRHIEPIGRLKLAPRVLKAEAGMISRLKVAWMHPQSWRELRKLQVRVYDGKQAVGTIDARPASGRVTGTGAVEVMDGSTVGHHGKWVTAKLAVDVPERYAGRDLRVDVKAVDVHGHKQLERGAGTIRVR